RRKIGQHSGFKQSPHTFSRGNFSRSINTTLSPLAAQKAAQTDPAGPPPMTATSKISISFQCPGTSVSLKRFRSSGFDVSSLDHELVPSHFSNRWNPVADSHHVFAADRLARSRLLRTRRLGYGVGAHSFCPPAFCLCRFAFFLSCP